MPTLYPNSIINTLNLEPVEVAILEYCDLPISLTKISSASGLPRTTLYPYVAKLIKRGLLQKITHGKRFLYKNIDVSMSPSLSDNSLSIFKGCKQLTQAWLRISAEPAGSTIIAIQPNSSLLYSISKSEKSIVRENHLKIIKKKIFIDYIVEEGMYDIVKNTLEEDLLPYESDFTGRMSAIHIIPSHYFQKSAEIFILTQSVLFLDWKKEIGYEIRNEHIRFMMIKYAELLKNIGKISNNHSELKKMFNKK